MSRVRRAWESEATETRETGFMLRATAVASVRILGSGETPSPSQGRQTPPSRKGRIRFKRLGTEAWGPCGAVPASGRRRSGWGDAREGGWPGLNRDGMLQWAGDAPSCFGVLPKGL